MISELRYPPDRRRIFDAKIEKARRHGFAIPDLVPKDYLERPTPDESLIPVIHAFGVLTARRPRDAWGGVSPIPIDDIRAWLDERGTAADRSDHFELLLHMDAVFLEWSRKSERELEKELGGDGDDGGADE